ncbi:MAG: amidase family protein, partial [Pseudomonadota bacterium]
MTRDDALAIGRLDAHAQAALIRAGEVSAAELVESAIQRIEMLDPALDAISEPAFDIARARAARPLPDGPMAGVPWLIKDSLDYPGLPSRGGSRSRSDEPVSQSYPFTRIWDAEGLVPVGKSAMPEFGLLPTTEPLMRPPTRNPWSRDRSPGGSSGGAAAALAAGLVPLAHGSDGAGSIRIPASCCGVVGLKPGRGASVRVRARSVIEDLIVSDVLMSRSVRDTAWAFAAAHPDRPDMVREPRARRLRIAFNLDTLDGGPTDPQVAQAAQRIAALCENLGHTVAPASPDIDRPAALEAMHVLWAHDGADCVDGVRGSGRDPATVLEPWTCALGAM